MPALLRTALFFVPALFARYATQTLLVAIPWILQGKGVDITSIAAALLAFYWGSLLLSFLAARFAHRLALRQTLQVSILLQGVFCIACLQVDSLVWLGVLRFLQGAAAGIGRPLAQIWALEGSSAAQTTAHQKAQISAWVQVAISVGMAIGSAAGVWLARVDQLALASAVVVLVPVALTLASVVLAARGTVHAAASRAEDGATARFQSLAWLRAHPLPAATFVLFFLNLASFNIWSVAVPYVVRGAAVLIPALLAALALALVLQPIAFGLTQLAISAVAKRWDIRPKQALIAMIVAHLASNVALALIAAISDPRLFALVFVVGGGVLAAFVYPLSMFILMDAMGRIDTESRTVAQRTVLLLFGVTGDLAQIIGGSLLALAAFREAPLMLLWAVALLALPMLWIGLRSRSD